MPAGPFDSLLVGMGLRLDEIRQELYFTDARATRTEGMLVARLTRAMAYVALPAALEDFGRDSLARPVRRAKHASDRTR